MTSTLPATVDPKRLQEVLDGRWAHVREDARTHLGDPEYAPVYGESMQEASKGVAGVIGRSIASGQPTEIRQKLAHGLVLLFHHADGIVDGAEG